MKRVTQKWPNNNVSGLPPFGYPLLRHSFLSAVRKSFFKGIENSTPVCPRDKLGFDWLAKKLMSSLWHTMLGILSSELGEGQKSSLSFGARNPSLRNPILRRLFVTCRGFSNVPWRKRAFGPGTKYVFLEIFLGILGALCTGKGAPLVRYLCTTWESLHMFFTKRCPSGGTEYVSFELFLGILRGLGEGRGGAPGTAPLQNADLEDRNLLK